MKALYFPYSSLMDAGVGSQPSFIWRSLCWARPIVGKGMRWCVNKGNRIRILKDPFLLDFEAGIPSAAVEQPPDIKVDSFFTTERTWDMDKLSECFWPIFAFEIARTPIGNGDKEDLSFWRFFENGLFTVKSAYLMDIGFFDAPLTMATLPDEGWEALIWNCKIPPKSKIFMWKALNDFIPVGINLRRHHVPAAPACMLCKNGWGTSTHTLIFCEKVVFFWKESCFWKILKGRREVSLHQLGELVRKEHGKKKFDVWVILLWLVWRFVCSCLHEGGERCRLPTINTAEAFGSDFRTARKALCHTPPLGVSLGSREWLPPPEGVYRVDVDVAVSWVEGCFGIGAAIRDFKGVIIAAMVKPIVRPKTVLGGELHAALCGLVLCIKASVAPVVCYLDSILAVRALSDTNPESAIVDEDMQEMLVAAAQSYVVGFYHMYRSANMAAHSLASFAKSVDVEHVWLSDIPHWVRGLESNLL